MKSYILYALLSATIVSLVAFIGILFLAFKTEKLQKIVFILVSFAVGSLFGSAFFVLIPESYHLMPDSFVPGLMIVAGVLTMFILEKFIHWRHGHTIQYIPKEASLGYVSLMTDSLHNFVDGVLIASAWAVSPEIGMVTTLSVIIHEVPQEISDFGILIYAGFSKKRALFFNFLAAVTALLGHSRQF
jgi:zinc and cadmium transporter